MIRILVAAFFLLFVKVSFAQNYVYNLDNEPIDYVNILYSSNTGIISNEDGYFKIPNNINIDSVTFSHLSYKTKGILLKDLKKNDTIFLEYNNILLDEVTIDDINPKQIVTNAINKIDQNYLNQPHNYFGFYRQSLLENDKGVQMIEVDFKSYYNASFNKYSAKINTARKTKNYSTHNIKTIGGVLNFMQNGDFVKNKILFLDIEKINNYKFEYKGKLEIDENQYAHKISFKPKDPTSLSVLRTGHLLIDSSFYAILEINYGISQEKIKDYYSSIFSDEQKKSNRPNFIAYSFNNIVKYRKLKNSDKWMLSYILSESVFKDNNNVDSETTYDLSGKLVISDINTTKPDKITTNYKTNKDFSKAIRRYDKSKKWDDNFNISLSEKELKIIKDILSYE